ncbi:RidA family protein [Deinococcus radiophilus]|uniref:RidA family protein n=1 Tax=Deinococcus radiophilus TaxID=32062 RepID=UPI003608EFA4
MGEGDFMAQARQVFRNLEAALAAVGADFGDVVKLTLFFTDRTDLAAFRQVRGEFIHPEQLPAMSAVQVAGLVQDDLLLELEAVAVVAD